MGVVIKALPLRGYWLGFYLDFGLQLGASGSRVGHDQRAEDDVGDAATRRADEACKRLS